MKVSLNTLQNKKLFFSFLAIIILFIFLLTTKLIYKKNPIKIGFVNTLTGAASTSTIKIRNVVVLAVEEVNKKGGINGHLIELIIKDDEFDPDTALKVDQELIDQGVIAIIGHSFSSLCLKVSSLIKEKNIIMITPTAQSTELTGIDDNFLKPAVSIDKEVKAVAITASKKLNAKKMSIVYDLINPGLSIPAYNYFKTEFEKHEGKIINAISFNSKGNFSAPNIAKKIIQSKVDGVYIISDAIHAALICQHLRMNNFQINIIAHGWAFIDKTLINEGGQAVEGVIGINQIDKNQANKNFLNFEKKYIERYGEKITGPALLAYESIYILFNALSKTNNPKEIKKVILKQKEFDGVASKIIFDKYGDVQRPIYIMKIQNGEQTKIGKIEVEEFFNY